MNTKKYYLIYQVTNNVNGKIYIGKHETNRLDDDYMGSGKILKRAQDKYGIENFTFNVLIYLHNREEMCLLERMVVNKEFCERTDTYNINVGGDGGWHYINKHRCSENEDERRLWRKKVSDGLKNKWKENPQLFLKNQYKLPSDGFLGKHHSEETKRKISQKNSIRFSGNGNPNYGKVWMHKMGCVIMVTKEQVNLYCAQGWKLGYKDQPEIDETNPAHFRCWINDGSKSKFVLKSEVKKFIENGWKLGRLSFIR